MHDFIMSFAKYWFPKLCISVDTLHYAIPPQNHFSNITTHLIRKAFKHWEVIKLTVLDTSLPEF